MKSLDKIKKDYVKANKPNIDSRMKIRERYETLHVTIGKKDHFAFLREEWAKAEKDMKRNLKAKKRYANVKECFLDRTIADYYVMAQNAMYGMFMDILSFRDWTETTEEIGIKESRSPYENVMKFLIKYYDEWEKYTKLPEYESEFRERFEKRFGDPEYMNSVPQLRALNIESLYMAATVYMAFMLSEAKISFQELYDFMNNEKFVGQSNTSFIMWNAESCVCLSNEDETSQCKFICMFFDIFTHVANNPSNNLFAVNMLNTAFKYKKLYNVSIDEQLKMLFHEKNVDKLLYDYLDSGIYGYLAYVRKPFGVK